MKEYKIKEIQKLLNISVDTWKRRREEIISEYLPQFWSFEIKQQGRMMIFQVLEEYAPLEPLPRKGKKPEVIQFYTQKTEAIVEVKPHNTGSNISREIFATDNKYNHAERTIANYVRPILKENYTVAEKIWAETDYANYEYCPLNQEQLEYLKDKFRLYLGQNSMMIADALADHESGFILASEAIERMSKPYNNAMDDFIARYGFRPIKVGKYERNAIDKE